MTFDWLFGFITDTVKDMQWPQDISPCSCDSCHVIPLNAHLAEVPTLEEETAVPE